MLPIYSSSRQSLLPVPTPNPLNPVVRGRYAPSPTGPLHFGSLVAAVGSYLEARCQGGEWLLRLEDVDEPRCRGPWADDILRTLEAFGFEWNGVVMVQSRRKARYQEALDALRRAGHAYPCACTRKELESAPLAVDGAHLYPGTCRAGLAAGKSPRAWRLRVPDETLEFNDAVQGPIHQNLATQAGDFVLLRADNYFAYQLAVVVDDADQGITHVVRGADLLDSTPRQIVLQGCLGAVTPAYAHLPVAVNERGEKLSKQTMAAPLDASCAPAALRAALNFLGQPVAEEASTTAEIWAWAHAHWRLERVPRTRGIPCPPYSR